MNDYIEKALAVALLALTVFVCIWGVWSITGHLTQERHITGVVTMKDDYSTVIMSGNVPVTTYHYHVYLDGSDDQYYRTSRKLYHQIRLDEKYTFRVTGFEGDEYIQEILEGN